MYKGIKQQFKSLKKDSIHAKPSENEATAEGCEYTEWSLQFLRKKEYKKRVWPNIRPGAKEANQLPSTNVKYANSSNKITEKLTSNTLQKSRKPSVFKVK